MVTRFSFIYRSSFIVLLALLSGAFLRFHELGRVPPGLHYDFAANAIIADGVAFDGWREVFITAYTGKEVLFFYTAGLIFKFVGSSIFALQFTAAVYGVLGIATCYFAARQLLWEDPDSKWIAALAAAILSFTFMHLVWSRYGERAVTEPFVQGLAVGFLFRALRFGAPASFHLVILSPRQRIGLMTNTILAGVFTGLAAYTYLAARLFPIPIAVTLFSLLIYEFRHLNRLKARLGQFAIYFAAAALVFAPLGWFFVTHPETFLVRANQLTPKTGEGNLLLQGITGALGMIFLSGELYDRFNIPGRPIFGPVLGFFFVLGFVLTVIKFFRPSTEHAIRNTQYPRLTLAQPPAGHASLFLLVYLFTFLIPTAISIHDIFPSNVRSMGLLPVLTIFPALGIVKASNWLVVISYWRSKTRPITNNYAKRLITAFTLTFGTLTTYYSYFNLWAAAPGLHYANDTDLVNAARWINTQNTQNTSVYFSAIHYRHPTVAYLARDFPSFRWFIGGQALAIPEGSAIYVFPHSAPPPEDWIAQWSPIDAPLGPDGTPDFRAYYFDSMPPLPDFISASANFGNLVELTGYRLVAPGVVDFRLHVLNLPDQPDYRLVADLVDVAGYHWAQGFNDSYFAEQWQAGETILMRVKIPIEIGTPPGNYQLLITIYSATSKVNLPTGSAAYATLGPISLPPTGPQPLADPLAVISGLNLIQLDPPPAHARPGEPLPFTTHWQASSPITNNQLLITKLNGVELESASPAHNTHPTSQWRPGEIVIDRHAPRLPRDLPPGVYNVTLNDFLIGTVSVEAIERQFNRPTPLVSITAGFGDQFELVGYDLTDSAITLYWQALKETEVDYTGFVHVLDASGQIVAQRDAQPQSGGYSTSLWVAGEYVADRIEIPTTGASIEIGWYVAETGERLKTDKGDSLRLP
ncbi:MAG: hypothetical protein HYZ49_20915 [Chloroflexi bacterium]|nr:hypothetical protein [Chloroflexota bacterium]